MDSNLIKSKKILQILIILNLSLLQLFAQVGLLSKCSEIDERLDAFKTFNCISYFLSDRQKFSTLWYVFFYSLPQMSGC